MHDDFVDLRSGNLSSESFWPSFTDIMMVVVMIFLLTSTVLMVKNWELVEKLRESMIAEQQASEMIRSTSEENATLEEQLAQAQYEVSMLRMQLMQASEHNNQLSSALDDKEKQIILIMGEKQHLENSLQETEQKVTILTSEVEQLNANIGALRTNFEEQADELKSTRDQIIILTKEKESAAMDLASLQSDYGSLKVKYDKLVKPARSAKGKYVVDVNYQRINDVATIRFKDSGETSYRTLSKEELHTILSKLKQKHPKALYIKIIIPKESGLTYNEAWTFMKDLLEKYDYYYQ